LQRGIRTDRRDLSTFSDRGPHAVILTPRKVRTGNNIRQAAKRA
jgi:hypothetical protein